MKIKCFFVTAFIIVLFCGAILAGGMELNVIRTIGDERDSYTFFTITGAAVTQEQDILILDGRGFFVSRFDREGTFLSTIGRKGQGPGDFSYPHGLTGNGAMFALVDRQNRRIATFDKSLNSLDYLRYENHNAFSSSFFMLQDGAFAGVFWLYGENRGRIGIMNRQGKIIKTFFDKYPLPIDIHKAGRWKTAGEYCRLTMLYAESMPVLGVDTVGASMLISFQKPDNPIVFYPCNRDGILGKAFYHRIPDPRYRISDFYFKASDADILDPKKYPKELFIPFIQRIMITEKYYFVDVRLEVLKQMKLETANTLLLVFDKGGNLVDSADMKEWVSFHWVTEDLLALASKNEGDLSQLLVYQLRLNGK